MSVGSLQNSYVLVHFLLYLLFANPTRQAVFDVDFNKGLTLIEIAEGVTVEEVKSKTEAPFTVSQDLKSMEI